ncbi:MAG TPA: TIGR03936 family radical SAM-associated protein [Anaerolineales bacterium]|nr:TIGR03936 family radical SAM-associated protein [Anaerolineales bacterium]
MRFRIKFQKQGPLRYIGHLDLHKIWERSARRAGIELVYSQGFHPQPKIQIAAALPLGFASRCEIVDLWASYDENPINLMKKLQAAVPNGLLIEAVEIVTEPSPPLQMLSQSAVYQILVPAESRNRLEEKAAQLLARDQIQRVRRGKPYDLKPLIEEFEIKDEFIIVQLSARESATGRPEELLDELGIPFETCFVERIELKFRN